MAGAAKDPIDAKSFGTAYDPLALGSGAPRQDGTGEKHPTPKRGLKGDGGQAEGLASKGRPSFSGGGSAGVQQIADGRCSGSRRGIARASGGDDAFAAGQDS